jgi:hypothetical protein
MQHATHGQSASSGAWPAYLWLFLPHPLLLLPKLLFNFNLALLVVALMGVHVALVLLSSLLVDLGCAVLWLRLRLRLRLRLLPPPPRRLGFGTPPGRFVACLLWPLTNAFPSADLLEQCAANLQSNEHSWAAH